MRPRLIGLLVLVATLPWSPIQGQGMAKVAPFYQPMMDAYDQNRLPEARQLARQYLETSRRELTTFTLDIDRDSAVRRATDLINTIMAAEAEYAPANRFANHDELMTLSQDVLRLAQDTVGRLSQPSDAVRQYFANQLAISSQNWISTAGPRLPRAQVQTFYQQFEPQMRASGRVADLDTLLRDGARTRVRPFEEPRARATALGTGDGQAILAVIQNYYDAVLSGDAPRLAASTGMSAQSANALIARRGDNFSRVRIRNVRGVTLPRLSDAQMTEMLKPQTDGTYQLYLDGIQTAVTDETGAQATRSVGKLFTLRKSAGRWTIVVSQQGGRQ